MKICTACKVPKKESSFAWRERGVRRHAKCKECVREDSKGYYRENPKRYLERNYKNKAIRRKRMRALLEEIKSKPCVDCGQTFPSFVMDLDHVRGKKIDNVADLIRNARETAFYAEVKKCEVVCANCHRIRTFGCRGVVQRENI